MMNPEAIDWFVRFAQESIDYQWRAANPQARAGRAEAHATARKNEKLA
jgi:acetoacetyl-CoA synthetase